MDHYKFLFHLFLVFLDTQLLTTNKKLSNFVPSVKHMNSKPKNIKQLCLFINLWSSSLFRCFQTICGVCYNCTFQNTDFQFYYLMTITQTKKISLENPLKVVLRLHAIRKMESFDGSSPYITLCHFFQITSVLCDSLKSDKPRLETDFFNMYGMYRMLLHTRR